MKAATLEERGLPCSPDAERFVIGSILLDPERMEEMAMTVESADFSLETNRRIWGHMERLHGKGIAVDRLTVAQSLRDAGELDAVGGLTYLLDLDEGMPRLSNLGAYCGILREKKLLRDVICTARSIEEAAILGTQNAAELINRADVMVRALGMKSEPSGAFLSPGDVVRAAGGMQPYLERSMAAGVPTCFPRLDEMTGGIRPGQLWVFAAYTGGGKSTLASHIAQNAANARNPGAFISLEMTAQEVNDGLICREAQIDTQSPRRGLYRSKIREAANAIADLPLYIFDQPGVTVPKIHAELRRLKAEKGIKLAVVDYLQLVTPVGRYGTRAEAVSEMSRGIKLIAMDLEIGIILLSQLSRQEKGTGKLRRPELSDLKESSSIEQDANVVIMLHTEYQVSPMTDYPAEVHIKKQRGGPIGMIPFLWRKATGTFIEESER